MSIDYTSYSDEVVENPEFVDDTVVETVEEEAPTMMGAIYNTHKVYLREKPSKESRHVSILDEGDEVMIVGVEDDNLGNGWYHLITASGNEGYTMSDFVKITE